MLVVPVPLHRLKYAERGFNQARSLAFHALDALGKSHPAWRLTLASSTLMRLRATESQAGLTPRQRRLNVRGAFEVSDPAAVTRSMFCSSTTFHHRRNGSRRGPGADGGRCGLRVGGHAGQGAPRAQQPPQRLPRALTMRRRFRIPSGTILPVEELAHDAWAADSQGASIFSSHDQPSF
jgi:hypothetical protein